ncbi:sulfotransferase domain-containing protein [Crocinitomicaceae bacterium]|nr:sulfotransferase domain-containing protein [Crocinitomicaceae bacterium]
MTKINTILVGAQKSGTTSLYDWMNQHPEINGHKGLKDYNFFAKDELYLNFGVDWFTKQFRKQNSKVILHGSVQYLYFKKAAKRIHDYNPDCKIILILRNPIDRAYSSYFDMKKTARTDFDDFKDALNFSENLIKSGQEQHEEYFPQNILAHGYYSEQILHYRKIFNTNQIKIILFDDFVKDPLEVMKDLFVFLKVSSLFEPELIKRNDSGLPRSLKLQKLIQNIHLPKSIKKYISAGKITQFRSYIIRNLNTKKVKHEPMSDSNRDFLRDYYNEEINRLEKLINRKLDHWKK